MLDINKYVDHNRIDQYFKRRSMQLQENKQVKNHENKLSNFPVGLIIITKDMYDRDKIEFINHYACQLFQLGENAHINQLKDKLKEYIKLKKNDKTFSNITLKDIIFNSSKFNCEIENFFPFQSKLSKYIILYIKINNIQNQKYIVIDKYDKYIEEQKYIELNLIKNINYQYLHTLYHELNNPLNALLAISGEKKNFDSSENLNKNIYNKTVLMKRKKTMKSTYKSKMNLPYKRENKLSGVSLNYNKKFINNNQDEAKSKKDNNNNNYSSQDPNSKINLLVKIIKIFLKNFILYLKTRADNLLTLQNEFNIQNEASDIINAVEVSEYEKDLTKHKKVKLNIEYVLDLYLQKYQCLFKYKEIKYEMNFSELKNIYILTDDFYFTYYIRQIYTYLYYIVPKKGGFYFEYDKKDNNKIKIIIKTKFNETALKSKEDEHDFSMNQIIQTKEMTKEVLYFMSQKLKFDIDFFDDFNNNKNNNDNNKQNIYLSFTMPIITKDKSTEEDEFKDEDINEMIEKSNNLLEEKIKRQLPIPTNLNKNFNNSVMNIGETISKNDEYKISETFFSYSNKNNNSKKDSMSKNNLSSKYLNINNNDFLKDKFLSFKSTPSNDSFLSKCLRNSDFSKKIEREKKEKSKFNKDSNQLNINYIQNNINKSSSGKNIFINITNINNSPVNESIKYTKTKSYNIKDNNIKNIKTQELKEVFNLINYYGTSEKLINCHKIYNISNDSKKNLINSIHTKKSLKMRQIKSKINNISKKDLNLRHSANFLYYGKRVPLKINSKSSDFISYFHDPNNEKNIKKNNIRKKLTMNFSKKDINVEYKKKKSLNKSAVKKETSNNINMNDKDCKTYCIDFKNINVIKDNNNTIEDDNLNDNKNLFLEADLSLRKSIQENKKKNANSKNEQNNEEEEDEEDEEEEDDEDEEKIPLQEQCNCTDLLVVDDEEFNVMASQRMLKNLKYESDKAFNGEECINLIKKKKENNCKCKKNYYKIIFLDIVMPVMDGIKAAKKIEEMIDNKEINENTKIVFVSGNIDGADLQKSLLEIKCVKECFQKPVQIAKYQKILEKYYNKNE